MILFTGGGGGGFGFPACTGKRGLASQHALGERLASQHAQELGNVGGIHPTGMLSCPCWFLCRYWSVCYALIPPVLSSLKPSLNVLNMILTKEHQLGLKRNDVVQLTVMAHLPLNKHRIEEPIFSSAFNASCFRFQAFNKSVSYLHT